MYVPSHFDLNDPAAAGRLIAGHPFGQLVTVNEAGAPFATHLPLLLEGASAEDRVEGGAHGILVGHMARANPQWRHFAEGREVLCVFAGPHAYVSPSWYGPGPAVPTWNYVAVHAYGVPRIVDDAGAVRAMLERLVETFEAARPEPWSLDEAGAAVESMMRAIVAFEIPVTRFEAKAKMSQNRSAEDRAGVIRGLGAGGDADPDATAVAAWMTKMPPIE